MKTTTVEGHMRTTPTGKQVFVQGHFRELKDLSDYRFPELKLAEKYGKNLLRILKNRIENFRKKLEVEAQVRGIYENFGQKEVRDLRDEWAKNGFGYGSELNLEGIRLIDAFDKWATAFDQRKLEQSKLVAKEPEAEPSVEIGGRPLVLPTDHNSFISLRTNLIEFSDFYKKLKSGEVLEASDADFFSEKPPFSDVSDVEVGRDKAIVRLNNGGFVAIDLKGVIK